MLPDPDRTELLAHIVAEGDRRRRRRLAATGGGAAVAVAVLAAGLTLAGLGGDGDDRVEVATGDDGTTTTTTKDDDDDRSTTTSSTATTDTTAVPSDATVEADPDVPPDDTTPTTEPERDCRNSHDPACGDFYWDYDPATFPNAPATMLVFGSPIAGQPTEVTFTLHDGDAVPNWACDFTAAFPGASSVEFLPIDGRLPGDCVPPDCSQGADPSPRYGPWDPPPPAAEITIPVRAVVTYDTPGFHPITAHFSSGDGCLGWNAHDQQAFLGYQSEDDVSTTYWVYAPGD